jgi:hypothetical protein
MVVSFVITGELWLMLISSAGSRGVRLVPQNVERRWRIPSVRTMLALKTMRILAAKMLSLFWTARKHGHRRLALVALAKNDASPIEDARFAPVEILLQIESAAHRIEGYVELLEYALPDVARKVRPGGFSIREIRDHIVDLRPALVTERGAV